MALTYSEQILLLAWDEQAGTLRALPELAMRYALAGALLLELALAGRIDMDLERLHLVDAQPTGDPLLDDILRRMGTTGDDRQATADWLNALAWQTPNLSDADHPPSRTGRPSVVVRGWPGSIQRGWTRSYHHRSALCPRRSPGPAGANWRTVSSRSADTG